MTHIAGSRLLVNRLNVAAGNVANCVDERVQRDAFAARDVERPTVHVARRGCEQVRIYGVVDVCEIARLLTIAVDHGRPAADESKDEAGDDGRVSGTRILSGSKDVEVTERHGL